MATIIRLNESITDKSAPKLPVVLTSDTFDTGDLTMSGAQLGGEPWPISVYSDTWSRQDGGITTTGGGALSLNDLPSDIIVKLTIKSLPDAGRLSISSRAGSPPTENREVVDINYDGSVRLNPRIDNVQQPGPYSAAGVVKPGSVVTFSTVGNDVKVLVDGEVVAEQGASVPAGGTLFLASYQMTGGLVVDDLVISAFQADPVLFERRDTIWEITTTPKPSWSVWSAGRVYPPAGRYKIELFNGENVEIRPSGTGVSLPAVSIQTIQDGDYILAMFSRAGQKILITPY